MGLKELTSYWARHSWATIAASLDIPKDTIAHALGHGGNTVTDIYIDFDQRKVDEANRRVLESRRACFAFLASKNFSRAFDGGGGFSFFYLFSFFIGGCGGMFSFFSFFLSFYWFILDHDALFRLILR